MANIKVKIEYPIKDGVGFTFHAPCDCSVVEGLTVEHPGGTQRFVFKDSHGNALAGTNNLFVAGALIKVVLDITNSAAFIQNADTNSYLEKRINTAGQIYMGSGDMPEGYTVQIDPDGAALEIPERYKLLYPGVFSDTFVDELVIGIDKYVLLTAQIRLRTTSGAENDYPMLFFREAPRSESDTSIVYQGILHSKSNMDETNLYATLTVRKTSDGAPLVTSDTNYFGSVDVESVVIFNLTGLC